MKCIFKFLSVALFVAPVAESVAQEAAVPPQNSAQLPSNPTKEIRIYNNTKGPIYAFIQSPTKPDDLWMQAQFKVRDWDNGKTQRLFKTTTLYRAYIETGKRKSGIEPTGGIDPGESVTITVPFYTQLKEVDGDDLGKVSDQFIDWWNAGRVYIFSSAAAYHSAKSFNIKDKDGNWVEPPKVTALNGAATLTCSSSNNLPCNIYTFEPKVNPPFNIPFELQEYTFGAAEGPPNQPPDKLAINIGTVNYNISSLDSVFLPVAVGALNNKDVP